MSITDKLIQNLRRAVDRALTFSDDVVNDHAMQFDDLTMRDRALAAFDAEAKLIAATSTTPVDHYQKPHQFDPIHSGADECECGLIEDADIHESDEAYDERMRPRITNAPERIWLQTGCDDEVGEIDWKELAHSEVSWCNERIHNADIEYVRVDAATTPTAATSTDYSEGFDDAARVSRVLSDAAALRTSVGAEATANEQCAWTLDDSNDGDVWETGCGEMFQFTDGGPSDNKFVFCYKCGKRIDAASYSDFTSVGEEAK